MADATRVKVERCAKRRAREATRSALPAAFPSMSVDLVHPAVEKVTLVLEGIGAGKVRVNSASLDHPVVILRDQGLEIVWGRSRAWPIG
jgi:hypothetical protein